MFVDSVRVFDNGTINGNVCHQEIGGPDIPGVRYRMRSYSGGLGHSKHLERGYVIGETGQDVHGHTDNSIFVADGHGPEGFHVASSCKNLALLLENDTTVKDLLLSTRILEHKLRSIVVDFLRKASHWPTSGSTFTQMILKEYGSKRWAVTINIGDSEAFLVYNNHIHMCSVAHNWDNLDIYRRYCLLTDSPAPVCYNRWNASSYTLKDVNGEYRPINMYSGQKRATIITENAKWVRKTLGKEYGTQSIRRPARPHENWGSCVLLHGRARGQNMATVGDCDQRSASGVPLDMVHIYIHEIPHGKDVVGCVQSDGISDRMTLRECGHRVWSCRHIEEYLQSVQNVRDDISAGMIYSSTRRKKIPCPKK